MDEVLGLLEGPITIVVVILITVAAVQLYKRWTVRKAEAWWYEASVVTAAWLMGIAWAALRMYANGEPVTWQTWATLAFHGGIIGMVASGGYKWFQKAREFVGVLRSGGVVVGGDNINIEHITESQGVTIGDDSSTEVDS